MSRLRAVPAPLLALLLLFVVSAGAVGVRLATDPAPQAAPAAADASVAPSSPGSSQAAGVLPGEVRAPSPVAPSTAEARLPAPRWVRIPAIDLDERLIDLGIAGDGTLEVPADPDRVGWFAGGNRPGGPGPVVVAAHVDSLEGPAVFARLSEVGRGDAIEIGTADGRARYVVTDVRAVPRDDFPTAQVFGPTEGDVVRLVTCHGPYDRGGIGYTENLVVSARRVA